MFVTALADQVGVFEKKEGKRFLSKNMVASLNHHLDSHWISPLFRAQANIFTRERAES